MLEEHLSPDSQEGLGRIERDEDWGKDEFNFT